MDLAYSDDQLVAWVLFGLYAVLHGSEAIFVKVKELNRHQIYRYTSLNKFANTTLYPEELLATKVPLDSPKTPFK